MTQTSEHPSFAVSHTPTVRGAARRWRLWIALAALCVVGIVVLVALSANGGAAGTPYSMTSAAPQGSKAVAEVLRDRGVTVVQAHSLDEARAAIDDAGATESTLLFYDPSGYLDDRQLGTASELSQTTVLFQPGFEQLGAFAPSVAQAGTAESGLSDSVGCSLPAAERAEQIVRDGRVYRDISGDASDVCFPSHDDAYSLVRTTDGASTVTVLGASGVLTNEGVATAGNAALALGLLGEKPTLVWYMPTAADLHGDGPADIASLAPDWVTPVLMLTIVTFIAAAVWRGRRLGALVVENLPVTVRSRETMEGRARLYASAGARSRALDALRIGTITRLTRALALPRNASVSDVAHAVAAAVPSWSVGDIQAVLVSAVPRNEAELIELSRRLLVLERAVTTQLRGR